MTRKDIFLLSETAFGIINEDTKSGPPYIKISKYGDKIYYKDKAMNIRHREDGPAIEGSDGNKFWYLNGKLHREDGPAVVWKNGDKRWYLNGKEYSEKEFRAHQAAKQFKQDIEDVGDEAADTSFDIFQ
jgi:hypothetical protein